MMFHYAEGVKDAVTVDVKMRVQKTLTTGTQIVDHFCLLSVSENSIHSFEFFFKQSSQVRVKTQN